MVTIDLSAPAPTPASLLDGLPRRLALTLPELRLVAHLAGNAPLPFDVTDPEPAAAAAQALSERLGETQAPSEAAAYAEALASLHDPEDTLRRRGLITDGKCDRGIQGAIGLLATPELALDIDVATGASQVRAWHRLSGGAVASLSTCDGIVFELAWFPVANWPDELARITALPQQITPTASEVPANLDAPYQLLDAIGEAIRSTRCELLSVLLGNAEVPVLADGKALDAAEAAAAISAVHTEATGRLRILAAQVGRQQTTDVGVVTWVLLSDGWHSLTPHHDEGGARVAIRLVSSDDLASELAPILSQVVS